MSRAAKGGIFVFLAALGYATEPVFVKFAYEAGLSPFSVTLMRLLVAMVVMLPVFARYASREKLSRRTWIALFLCGAVGHAGVMFLLALALQRISASVTILCLYLYPTVTTLFAAPVLGERVTPEKILALVGSLAGVALVAWAPGGAIEPIGVMLAISAALVNGFLIIAVKRWFADLPPLVSSAGVLCFAALPFSVAGIYSRVPLSLPTSALPFIVGLGIIPTIGSQVFLYRGLSMIEASAASIIATSEPAMTAALAAIFLGERLSLQQLLGGALVIGCTAMASLAESQRQRPGR